MNKINNGIVYVKKISPETILDDYSWLIDNAKLNENFEKNVKTFLKVNISWDRYYPGCSSAPWQIEGVLKKLIELGFNNLEAAHNGTVVVDPERGRIENKHKVVEDKYNIPYILVDSPKTEALTYKPKKKLLVLDKIFPEGIMIPKLFYGSNIIHLPTMKTHVFTTMTGALKNAFGGLLNQNRHWTHADINETLVDLLTIQK